MLFRSGAGLQTLIKTLRGVEGAPGFEGRGSKVGHCCFRRPTKAWSDARNGSKRKDSQLLVPPPTLHYHPRKRYRVSLGAKSDSSYCTISNTPLITISLQFVYTTGQPQSQLNHTLHYTNHQAPAITHSPTRANAICHYYYHYYTATEPDF